ncbi:MAG TPA: CVNH domain-containing protein [Candidatus Angelobacter sp.]|nr:CVNH domain-containing protein [Candidatus Angelobacter sp.]
MRRLISSCVVALTFIVLQGSALKAQSFPSGSYQQTCRNIDVRGEILVANCQDSDGRWEATQLRDYRTCGSDIINDNGALRCNNGVAAVQEPGYPAGVPGGSYTQTCQEIRIHGDDLEARCQNSNGDWHKTKLDDYQKCHGDVANDNGTLRCVAGAYPPGYPGAYRGGYPGPAVAAGTPYTQTCKDIKSHGDDLQARCKNSNGDWQNTSLDDYQKCHGQIVNQDGNLRCVATPIGYPAGVPAGSYTQSCQEIHINGDDLKARCSTANGDVRDAKLDDYAKCRSDIINDDGHLRCSK